MNRGYCDAATREITSLFRFGEFGGMARGEDSAISFFHVSLCESLWWGGGGGFVATLFATPLFFYEGKRRRVRVKIASGASRIRFEDNSKFLL